MNKVADYYLIGSMVVLLLTGVIVLKSISPELFPIYFVYIFLALASFLFFTKIDFDILVIFSPHLYVFCIIFLVIPLLIGQVTRGAVRWIPIGSITIQPSEIVRPFLLIFLANTISGKEITAKLLLKVLLLTALPIFLVLSQPALGVAILTTFGFLGIILTSSFNKKYLALAGFTVLMLMPLIWSILAPYQKLRVLSFLNPEADPQGAGYNSIQSMISVGSGRLLGRGLGEGVQTQLKFLPEAHTDFIFAATAEELGFAGSMLLICTLLILHLRLLKIIENSKSLIARSYVAGIFFMIFAQTFIHIGMNMGMLPITGVPLPFVSAGGSALLGTAISLAIAMRAKKE